MKKKKAVKKKTPTLVLIAKDMSSILGLVLGLKASVQEIAEHVGLVTKLPTPDAIKKETVTTEQTLQS